MRHEFKKYICFFKKNYNEILYLILFLIFCLFMYACLVPAH